MCLCLDEVVGPLSSLGLPTLGLPLVLLSPSPGGQTLRGQAQVVQVTHHPAGMPVTRVSAPVAGRLGAVTLFQATQLEF